MILSPIVSFLGGSAFRMIWGEVSALLTARQEHKYELQRMQLQGSLEAAQHERNLAAIRVQAELGVKTVEVQRDADIAREEATAFREAVSGMLKPIGIAWVDAWNASVRPAFATVVLLLWTLALHRASWIPTPWDLELMAAIAGFFFADRSLGKRGK